jgi:hypothetical protein
MNKRGTITDQLTQLVDLFAGHCTDASNLTELSEILGDRGKWPKAHELFGRIRRKNIAAQHAQDHGLISQYDFEEICAKTIYNLSGRSAPFDSDSPYWVIPTALTLAQSLQLDTALILAIVSPRGSR